MTYKVELIEWLDHCSLDDPGVSWYPISRVQEDLAPEIIRTVGWVVKETDDILVVVGSFGQNNDHVADDTLIIKSCIKRRLILLDDNAHQEDHQLVASQ